MNVGRNKAFVFNEMPHSRSQQNMTPEHIASMKKKIISIRATKRILAPYVKARRKPKEAPVENVHFSFYIQKKPSILMKVMTKWSLAADLLAVMTETVQVLGEITKSTSATVYMVDDSMGEIYQVIESYDDTTTRMSSRSISEKPRISYKIETGTTVAAHVAYTKEIIKLDDLLEDIRFPGGLGNNEVTVKSVLCVPVLSPDSECLAVFELYRDMDHDVYSDGDLNIVILMGTWIGSTIYHNQQLVTLRKQHELTGYLLQLTECYFDDAKLLDKLISEIVNFAKIALDAENAMFYVLKECSADEHEIFVDEYSDKPYTEALCKTKNVEIIGTSRSKADLVNLISDNHNIVNIKHSTNDYRLKREQKRTKYKIRCLIATAIKCSDQVLGVMELFNKKDGPFFTKSDEILLKTFSDYCGLVLKFAHEYEKSRKVEKLNETYESMLNKNMVGCIHDSLFVISQPNIPFIPDKFNQFDFYLPEELDMYVPQLIMYMFEKLNPQMFKDKTSMAEFVLGIKKAYSDLPYHNFEHGFHVCHCMYNILSRCSLFDPIETTALILAAYCHGIDHKGVTNSFLKITDHPLANLYESNYLENHYFFVAKIIIERQINAVDFRVSSDLRFVLLISDVVRVYTYTKLAKYHVVDIATRQRFPLSYKEDDTTAPFLQYATWSPDGIAITFVYNNDVYYKPRVNSSLICRITSSGIPGVLFNGIPDWLYEHEILKTDHSLWFSNDGKYLMFVTYNDSLVGEYKYPWYDSTNPTAKYPQIRKVRYPKVNAANPEVIVNVVNLKRPKYLFPTSVKPTNSVESDSYITHVTWYSNHQVAVVWLNRRQNMSVIATCKSPNFTCTNLHIEKAECGWTEPIFHPIFARHGGQAVARFPVKDGNKGNYMHACLIQSGVVIPITHGPFELTRILAWDEDTHTIYVMATGETDPAQRHLYKIGDTNSSQPWTCMTCFTEEFNDGINDKLTNISSPIQRRCNYNNIIFSYSYRFYVQECWGPDIPTIYLVETSTNLRLAELDTSDFLRQQISSLASPQIKRIGIEIEDKYRAQVRLLYPPGLREYEEVTFPLVLLVDAKPGSQSVSEKWEIGWSWYLASNRNYIVAQIDGGGSGYQGEKMRRTIQNRLGSEEVTDQLTVLKYLIKTFKFIDQTKVCAVGKGYGGYVTAMMLAKDEERIVNCSVSIAPITNWQFYNSYFTERYLEDAMGYERGDLTRRAGDLIGRHFLLIHGTADTVVKPQHAMVFAKALVERGVLFKQLVYPDETHTFDTSKTHLYREIDQFFDDSFGPVNFDDWESDDGFFLQ